MHAYISTLATVVCYYSDSFLELHISKSSKFCWSCACIFIITISYVNCCQILTPFLPNLPKLVFEHTCLCRGEELDVAYNYKLLPNAKQATVEKQMSSSTLEQFKHLFIASVVRMRRWWASCTKTVTLLNVRGLSWNPLSNLTFSFAIHSVDLKASYRVCIPIIGVHVQARTTCWSTVRTSTSNISWRTVVSWRMVVRHM